ncbi:YebB family permuted papain-like enzyme [Pseudoduganella violaceinigra]|uniref:YebB family permuted papain-like enzyme n=1 Tax=Pseudoduganella violaceinigra TaxID=246602 RepID=UPI00040F0864|nr:YebB family permuted papain-like enzyme [Pseudoduganella violaceinigra]
MRFIKASRSLLFALISGLCAQGALAESALPAISQEALASQLQVGDLVFIRVSALPFREVAATTGSWTNHVGIVVATDGGEPVVAESTFPLSKRGGLARFIARSEDGRVEISRLNSPLSAEQQNALVAAAEKRIGVFYDTGFDLHSRRQFCSRYVHEVVQEATGVQVGQVQTFGNMLAQNPDTKLNFWRLWYFGRIPWERETVTPASVLKSAQLHAVFDGYVTAATPAA